MSLEGIDSLSNAGYLAHYKQGCFGRTGNGTVPVAIQNVTRIKIGSERNARDDKRNLVIQQFRTTILTLKHAITAR